VKNYKIILLNISKFPNPSKAIHQQGLKRTSIILIFYLVSSGECQEMAWKRPRLLPSQSFPVHWHKQNTLVKSPVQWFITSGNHSTDFMFYHKRRMEKQGQSLLFVAVHKLPQNTAACTAVSMQRQWNDVNKQRPFPGNGSVNTFPQQQ
jgi:hypothetical protein